MGETLAGKIDKLTTEVARLTHVITTLAMDMNRVPRDELYAGAKRIVIRTKRASTSLLQRQLGIGYARAASLIDQLEKSGIVGPAIGATPREVLMRR